MVNFISLDWSMRCPEIWPDITSGYISGCFLYESITNYFLQYEWASSIHWGLGYNKRQGQGKCTLSAWLFFSYVIALLLPSDWDIHNWWFSSLWTWTGIYTISSSGSQALGLRLKLYHQHFGSPACRWHIKRRKNIMCLLKCMEKDAKYVL